VHAGGAEWYRCVCSEPFAKRRLYTACLGIAAFASSIFCGLCLLCAADQAAKLANMGESA